MSEDNFNEIISDIVTIKNSLTDVSFGAIPKIIDKAFGSLAGFNCYYGLSFVNSGELYGTALVGFKPGQVLPSMDLLKSFSHMAALSLQKRKSDEKLKESEERYRLLIQNQGEGVGIVDLNEKFVFVNTAAEEMFGVKPGELLDRNFLDFVSKDQVQKVIKETSKRAKSEKSSYEIDIYWKNGDRRTLLITATPQFNKQGTLTGTFGVFRDITDRKRAEEALRESEEKFRSISENSADAIFIADMKGRYVYTNKAVTDLLGYSSEEMKSKTIVDLAPKNKIEQNLQIFRKCIAEGKVSAEIELLKNDGKLISIDLNSVILPGGLVYGSCRDITERKLAEKALKESEFFFKESQRAASVGSYKTDFNKGFWESSEVLDKIFGIDKNYSRSIKGWSDLIHPDDNEMMDTYLNDEVISRA